MTEELAQQIGKAIAAELTPVLQRIEAQLAEVDSRVASFVPRRAITDTVKQRHREALARLGGRCPCCGTVGVVGEDGSVLPGAEWDHFYSRERRDFGDVWLICKPCHRGMQQRHDRTIEFMNFHRKAAALESGQLRLIP